MPDVFEWYFDCHKCRKVMGLSGADARCPVCGSADGDKVSAKETEKRFKAGVYFDPRDKRGKGRR